MLATVACSRSGDRDGCGNGNETLIWISPLPVVILMLEADFVASTTQYDAVQCIVWCSVKDSTV